MITQEKIDRINALARKPKPPEGLTAEQTPDREALRREYIDAHKQSLVRHLENTYVQYSDGTRRKLKRRQPPDSGKI